MIIREHLLKLYNFSRVRTVISELHVNVYNKCEYDILLVAKMKTNNFGRGGFFSFWQLVLLLFIKSVSSKYMYNIYVV